MLHIATHSREAAGRRQGRPEPPDGLFRIEDEHPLEEVFMRPFLSPSALSGLPAAGLVASGDITVDGGDPAELRAGTASGDIIFSLQGLDIRTIEAESVVGDVSLTLNRALAFEARIETHRGRVENLFEDAEPIMENDRVVGYRRGTNGARIEITTAHGDLSLAPAR